MRDKVNLRDQLEDKLKETISGYFDLDMKESVLDDSFSASELRVIADAMDKLKQSYVECLDCGEKWQYATSWSSKRCKKCGSYKTEHKEGII